MQNKNCPFTLVSDELVGYLSNIFAIICIQELLDLMKIDGNEFYRIACLKFMNNLFRKIHFPDVQFTINNKFPHFSAQGASRGVRWIIMAARKNSLLAAGADSAKMAVSLHQSSAIEAPASRQQCKTQKRGRKVFSHVVSNVGGKCTARSSCNVQRTRAWTERSTERQKWATKPQLGHGLCNIKRFY